MVNKYFVPRSQIVLLLLAILLLANLLQPSRAASNQVFLKVNQYYVLFTNPIVPFVNHKGRVIVGLQGFCDLVGAKTVATQSSTTVYFQNSIVKFFSGSETAYMNGMTVHLAEAPRKCSTIQYPPASLSRTLQKLVRVGPATQLTVPLDVLVGFFHMQSAWQQNTHTMLITRQNLLLDVDSSLWAEHIERFEVPVSQSDLIIPSSLSIISDPLSTPIVHPSIAKPPSSMTLKFVVKNASRQRLARGQVYVNIFSSGGFASGPPVPSVDVPNIAPLGLKIGGEKAELIKISGPNVYFSSYIVSWLVVRK